MRRTARKKLLGACRRRHLKSQGFIKALNRRLRVHYNYYGMKGNMKLLTGFYNPAIEFFFKWLNRRGGKRKSFTWKAFIRALDRLGVAKPLFTETHRKHKVWA